MGVIYNLFCQVVDLCIANRQIECGEFTYCSTRGQSVVDYLLSDFFDMQLIKEFKVLPFNEFSDHAPLLTVFYTKRLMSESLQDQNKSFTKVIWDNKRSHTLLSNLQEKRHVLAEMSDNLESDIVDKSVQDFTSFLFNKVSTVMSKTIKVQHSTQVKKVSNGAKIRNRYNQVPHLTQDTNGKVTNSQKTPQTRAKRSALSQQVTTKHI